MARDRVTQCTQWYELNLAALKLHELWRADGFLAVLIGGVLWRLPGLFGAKRPGGMIFPAEVTLVWDVPLEKLEVPEDLADLDFEAIGAFTLPEFSGDNVTMVLIDPTRTVYCEVITSEAGEIKAHGNAFTTHLGGPEPVLVKTIQSWKISPLDRPENYPVRCVRGGVQKAYEKHLDWVETFDQRPLKTTLERFLDASHKNHEFMMEYYAERGLYIKARKATLKQHLRDKRLKLPE